jgi:hypothetical protein
MKKLTFLIFLSLICIRLIAQDTIVMTNGEEIPCYITDVSQSAIFYNKTAKTEGHLFSLDLRDVSMIRYHNGGIDLYNNEANTGQSPEPVTVYDNDEPVAFDQELYRMGLKDGYQYYYKYKAASTGTLLTALLLNGLFGLVPAIACSLTPPRTVNLCYPSQELMNDPSYQKGYKDAAKKKKSQKVWLNWGVGTIISTAVILLAASIQ